MTDLSAVKLLLAGYLHQDFRESHGDSWGAIGEFARCEPEDAPMLKAQVTALLATGIAEDDLRRMVLDEFHSCYLAEVDGWTYRSWLAAVADRVEAVVADSKK